MRANYHTHTPRCKHALGNSIFEYANKAYEGGLEILGFSDHAPFPDYDFGNRMDYVELQDYFAEVDKVKEMYQDKMQVYKGLEIEYLPKYCQGQNYYEYLLTKCNCEYLLLGEHFFVDKTNTMHNIYTLDDQELILSYAKALADGMKTGYFAIVAHPDLFGVHNFPWNDIYDKACDLIIDTALATNTILEFNANGFRRGIEKRCDEVRYMYPWSHFWNNVKDSGVRVIIGSDSHNPTEIVDSAIDIAESTLKELGITPIDEFLHR